MRTIHTKHITVAAFVVCFLILHLFALLVLLLTQLKSNRLYNCILKSTSLAFIAQVVNLIDPNFGLSFATLGNEISIYISFVMLFYFLISLSFLYKCFQKNGISKVELRGLYIYLPLNYVYCVVTSSVFYRLE